MSIELTVLGCSGSYPTPASGPCSGYLLRSGGSTVLLDCGNGVLERLQRHAVVDDLTGIVISHRHADHCVDLLTLHVMLRYYRGLDTGPPVIAPAQVLDGLSGLSAGLDSFFAWDEVGDGDERGLGEFTLRFSRTDHSVPAVAVEASAGGKTLIYTADTGPKWSAAAFGVSPDLLLSEATYQHESDGAPVHLTAGQAGAMAAATSARRLVITHLAPAADPAASVALAEETYGRAVTLAAPDLRVRI